jgi:hypothetical protein
MNANELYLFISIFEVIYIYYMILVFKTKFNFDKGVKRGIGFIVHPLNKITNNYFHHSKTHSDDCTSFVCKFGKDVAKIAMLWLLLRNIIPLMKKYNRYFIFLCFLLTFLNFNTLIYILPMFILEYYLYKYPLKNL